MGRLGGLSTFGILSIGLLLRLPGLTAPLHEGAAGKQAHTAMIARNLERGRCSWLRPMVDDIGRPGYFVKEIPVIPAAAALLHRLSGASWEIAGRSLGLAAWMGATALFLRILSRESPPRAVALAGLWFVTAPGGVAYSRAFLSDPAAIAASLWALRLALGWVDRPTAPRAVAFACALCASLLLKPHAAVWLLPAALVAIGSQAASGAQRRQLGFLFAVCAAALVPAGAWYLHAAGIHRQHPVHGAVVLRGWIDPGLWLRPDLYLRIAGQWLEIVFTPAGAALAAIALLPGRPRFSRAEAALLAWGVGVFVQSILFGTRMFDDVARGTEYYQLPAVAAAAVLVGRGLDRIAEALERFAPRFQRVALGALLLIVTGMAYLKAIQIETPHPRYAGLERKCERLRALTQPDDDIVVFSDRGGTVLYSCDRRGITFSTGPGQAQGLKAVVDEASFATALTSARWVFLPFPEIIPPSLRAYLDGGWDRVPDDTIVLYAPRHGS